MGRRGGGKSLDLPKYIGTAPKEYACCHFDESKVDYLRASQKLFFI